MSPLIRLKELADIYRNPDVVIVDVSNSKEAKSNFKKSHLIGTRFIDLNSELSDTSGDPKNGGRHPLPKIEDFISVLESTGISPESHVVCYDTFYGENAAARFWWMLRAINHKRVQVLNGGFQIPLEYNFLLSSDENTPENKSIYTLPPNTQWTLPISKIEDVKRNIETKDFSVIDVREASRYHGIVEPIDLKAGHIPGAINIPLKNNLTADGYFKTPEEIKKNYSHISSDRIIHCGSGVTACHSILAMDFAKLPIPSLYVGSWSEWSRQEF